MSAGAAGTSTKAGRGTPYRWDQLMRSIDVAKLFLNKVPIDTDTDINIHMEARDPPIRVAATMQELRRISTMYD